MVLNDSDNMHTMIKFASLCRKNGRMELSRKTLSRLLGDDPNTMSLEEIPGAHPHVAFASMKHMWESGKQSQAYEHLSRFVVSVEEGRKKAAKSPTTAVPPGGKMLEVSDRLLSK